MEKILIVEDDIAFGTMIQTWLKKKGFEVEKATSVKAAIQIYEKTESGFDLVLSDLRLPDHDGIFLLQWMRKHGMQVPFIVMTSYAEIQNVVLAMKSGATDYVAKPFHPDILLDKIKEAIKNQKNSASAASSEAHATAVKSQQADSASVNQTQNTSTSADNNAKVASPAGDVPKYLEGESEASRKLYSFASSPYPYVGSHSWSQRNGKGVCGSQNPRIKSAGRKTFLRSRLWCHPKGCGCIRILRSCEGSLYGSRPG